MCCVCVCVVLFVVNKCLSVPVSVPVCLFIPGFLFLFALLASQSSFSFILTSTFSSLITTLRHHIPSHTQLSLSSFALSLSPSRPLSLHTPHTTSNKQLNVHTLYPVPSVIFFTLSPSSSPPNFFSPLSLT